MTDITLIARATADAALRFTQSGKPVTNLSLADNHRRRDGDQWVDDGVTFYQVTAWGHLAEQAAQTIRKGQRVIVVGELRDREYESRDGGKGRSLDIRAQEIGVALDRFAPRETHSDPWRVGGRDEEPPF